MLNHRAGKSLWVGLALIALSACSTTDTGSSQANGGDGDQVGGINTSAASRPAGAQEAGSEHDAQMRQQQRVIYFAFDDSTIDPQYREALAAHARFLADNPQAKVRVEGHCDERGTPDYNIALGERRAKSVQRVLMSYNVAADQIEVVSYGEERPAALGHDESAWSKNRRVELVY